MAHAIRIGNGRVLAGEKWLYGATVAAVDGRIVSAGADVPLPDGAIDIDAGDGYIIPGFIDAHMHGCGGADFMDGTAAAFDTIARTAARHGTTAIAPTTTACPEDALCRLFDTYRGAVAAPQPLEYLGVHLEGPFLSQAMRGAQASRHVRPATAREVDALLTRGDGIIARCSAAPEVPGVRDMARRMRERGIALSVAHSDATCEQILEAFDWGFTHITHLYSNTPSVRKIGQRVHAGVVEAAYLLDGMTVEMIGDGRHAPKELIRTVLKLKGAGRTLLISDAMRAAGLDCAESYLGEPLPENRVIIEDGVAKLPDRSYYAGSIVMSDEILRIMALEFGIPLTDALRMMTMNPARHLGVDGRKGSLDVGKDADIVVLDTALNVRHVISRGRVVAGDIQEEGNEACRKLA